MMEVKQQQRDGGARHREGADAEAIPAPGHLELGVQGVVHQGELHLHHLVHFLAGQLNDVSVAYTVG
jgi:hypothetical protein